jgi:hypothetical protein
VTDPVGDAARSAAMILAPDLGANLPTEVEAALAGRHAGEQRPGQYDPLAIASLGMGAASLIVSIAQLAWSIVSDRRKHVPEPSADSLSRQVLITLRQRDTPEHPGTGRITDVIVTEIIRLEAHPGGQARNT